jgi:hypothetical protein
MSVKDPANIFDLSPKWQRTLPSFGSFSWIMHFKPTAGCHISTLIFENKLWRGSLKYPIENISRTAKFLPTWGLD